jgi:hypothetical protein
MKLDTQLIKRIAAVVALTAASTSAFAQSADYRRGYDDGYEAGQRDARGDHGGRALRGRLKIDESEYGARGGPSCDPSFRVAREFERTGSIRVRNELCGDPAPGEQKRLRIIYRCGDSEPMRAFAREGETLRLRCRR